MTSRIAFSLPAFATAFVAAVAPGARAEDPPLLEPGGRISFTEPDTPPIVDSSVKNGALCQTGTVNGKLGSLLVMTSPKGEGRCEVSQHNDFVLEGAFLDSVLRARISGSFAVAGFQQLVGLGQVQTKVTANVIDLGDDLASPSDDRVIASETLAVYELVERLEPSVGAGVAVDLGSATAVQAGVDVGFGLKLPLGLRVIRDSGNFGFEVLLRRGHTYRLKVFTTSRAKLSITAGLATAGFLSPDGVTGAADPDTLFDPQFWLDTLGLPMKDLAIPNVQAAGFPLFTFPELSFDAPSIDPPLVGTIDPPKFTLLSATTVSVPDTFPSTHEALSALGLPPDVAGLLLTELLGFGKTFAQEEGILGQGVEVTNLAVRLQEDAREQALRLKIEQNLARASEKKTLASFVLPAAYGGHLERVRRVAQDAIERMMAAGEDVGPAQKQFGLAESAYAAGKYRAAYEDYRLAYESATSW